MFTMTINEMEQDPAILIAREHNLETGYVSEEYFWEYAENITEITFEGQIDVPANAFKSWDVSETQNGKIMACIIDDGLDNNTYHLYIQSNTEILANSDSTGLFFNFSILTMINNINLLNTSAATNVAGMFADCSSLTSLDLSNFNTSSVTDVSWMFSGCSNLTSLDLNNFNTSNVTNMAMMFWRCSSLTRLDLSNSIVHDEIVVSEIFCGCNDNLTLIVDDPVSKSLYESWKIEGISDCLGNS